MHIDPLSDLDIQTLIGALLHDADGELGTIIGVRFSPSSHQIIIWIDSPTEGECGIQWEHIKDYTVSFQHLRKSVLA